MAKAFKGPLQNNQQQTLYTALAADPKIVNHSGLTPSKVSDSKLIVLLRDQFIFLLMKTLFLAASISRTESWSCNRDFIETYSIESNIRVINY